MWVVDFSHHETNVQEGAFLLSKLVPTLECARGKLAKASAGHWQLTLKKCTEIVIYGFLVNFQESN